MLRTALPLRDDFSIYLDGAKLEPSKTGKGRLRKWILGKDIDELPEPALDEIEAGEDKNQPRTPKHALVWSTLLGRITGYAEAYRDLLTGKSDELGRSHGFFVYVFGRLINVEDGHFGIRPMSYGTARLVVSAWSFIWTVWMSIFSRIASTSGKGPP